MTDFGRRAGAHKTTHQDGGSDEISIAGLSGQAADDQLFADHALGGTKHLSATLAQLNAKVSDANLDDSGDPRTPSGHKASHQDGGSDEISIAGLSGQAADDQPPAAHALGGTKHTSATLAQLNAKVSDATLDDSGDPRTPSGHKASHQDGGADEISVAGLVGTTPRALLGDATAGRNFRASKFLIQDGSNADTIKCTFSPVFNSDTIAETDNIAKGATTGAYTLDSDGYFLTIDHAYLSGNVLLVLGLLDINICGTRFTLHAYSLAADIVVVLRHTETGGPYSVSTLVDVGDIHTALAYITDA